MLIDAVNPPDTPPEWGVVAVIAFLVMVLMAVFVWWVRSARIDLRQVHEQFIQHLTRTGDRQTEAIVSASEATKATTKALENLSALMDRHERRAEERHKAVISEIRREGPTDGGK